LANVSNGNITSGRFAEGYYSFMKWSLAHNGTLNNMTNSTNTSSVIDSSPEAMSFRACDTNNDSVLTVNETLQCFAQLSPGQKEGE
jgi:hypothetical protein